MKFIRPTAITDARLISSTVPETDYAAWVAATSYTVGQRVIRTTTHMVYECLIAGVNATLPELAPTRWLAVAPTNRWGMFDQKIGTVTTVADGMTIVLAPGRINSLALLGLDAATVTVTLVANATTVYSASTDLTSGVNVGNWYQYFYEPVYSQSELVITNLIDAALLDLPAYGDGVLTVTITRTGGNVSLGMLIVGLVTDVGETQYGASVSIRDYSRKEADAFGNYQLVERAYSQKMSLDVMVLKGNVDSVVKNVSRYRATNVVWIGSTLYGSLIVYGFVADWRLTVDNFTFSQFHAEIEGMT